MENLPETLYVDPTDGSSSSVTTDEFSERARIEHFINLLYQPLHREEALVLLNKERRCNDMPVMLWNAKNVSFILLQEISMAYKLLSPAALSMKEATRVCNALALMQSMASHPDTRMNIVKAKLPVYIYPFLNTTEKAAKHFDYLRLTSLGVIGALVKVEDANTPEIIHFLLDTEVLPLCLRCIEVGSDLAKTVAAFIVSKILLYDEGQRYCGTFPERFFSITKVLEKTVDEFHGKPPSQLLKHILKCFLRLSEVSRACDALVKCYPARLRDPAYLNFACEDMAVRRMADQVLQNLARSI
ncbi:cell differentiation protein rcd1 [Helianthus annuus]|uniref:cell differentiation protein rcd1 n=1 Tax=Helianthus annuus TaxID=4232 RepID=UPI000B908071|nr:cell differentiation protein rcd1 [Helianthus annuus]